MKKWDIVGPNKRTMSDIEIPTPFSVYKTPCQKKISRISPNFVFHNIWVLSHSMNDLQSKDGYPITVIPIKAKQTIFCA